ncbi:Tetratricopeptide repeat (TPR)-like superfamily protein [Euphorbia peplus]|nr:Tetratricopeptide repeat (TPR)-like superfamily protein [Euphorbia peplus]
MAQATKLRHCLNRALPWNSHALPYSHLLLSRSFSSVSNEPNLNKNINTKVNFSPSHSDSDSDSNDHINNNNNVTHKPKLPPPYNPFTTNPPIKEPEDPKDLQLIFHKMRTEGLLNNAVKMFDALSQDGLTHEALQLFSQIKEKGHMPDVVGHTAVIEAYANAGGRSKEAVEVFLRMVNSGVKPNAYTYSVLIKGLVGDGKVGDAKKYVMEMMGKGMRPNVGTYVAVFEGFVERGMVEEAKEMVVEMKEKGFSPDEESVCEVLKSKRGENFATLMNVLFNK